MMNDTRFLIKAAQDGLRPGPHTLSCPFCHGALVRDWQDGRLTYQCATCEGHWAWVATPRPA